jgi:hypothetical protein
MTLDHSQGDRRSYGGRAAESERAPSRDPALPTARQVNRRITTTSISKRAPSRDLEGRSGASPDQ